MGGDVRVGGSDARLVDIGIKVIGGEVGVVSRYVGDISSDVRDNVREDGVLGYQLH